MQHVVSILADGSPLALGIMEGENPVLSLVSMRTACARRVALAEMRAPIWWYTPFNTPHVLESSSTEVP